MGRREIREQIFKLLFRIEFNEEQEMPQQKEFFFEPDGEEESPRFKTRDIAEITEKFDGIVGKIPEIDSMINEKASGWNTKRM